MAVHLQQAPRDGRPEIVLAGRSNVGKSSLVNGLCQRKNIARISQTPGKTQSVLYFLIDNTFYLTD
ncbi:MAG TPA: YihA family ribosome biogenesis GTP-binding protein, partial [Clostridiaceae bacterium]|nr:YihA family ribosome biogenesis GTP-binding protein [Clostridiaceae bacterium]